MRVTIRVKLMLAFLAVAAVCLFVGVIIPLQISLRGSETLNRTLLEGQVSALWGAIEEGNKKARAATDVIGEATPIRIMARLGNLERLQLFVDRNVPPQGEPKLEFFILPADLAPRLKGKIQRIRDQRQFPLLRCSDLEISEDSGRSSRKAYAGDLNIIKDSDGTPLATVFAGFPLVEDLEPKPLRAEMFQEGSAFVQDVREALKLDAEIEFIAPDSEKFKKFLATEPNLADRLLGTKTVAFADDIRQQGQIWQVGYVPMVSLDGDVISVAFFRVPKPTVLKFWKNVQFTFYVAFLITAAVVVVLVVRLSRSISRPVRLLAGRARAITSGELDKVVEVKTNDEISDLAEAFNTMQAELKRTLEELQVRAATIEEQNRRLDQSVRELSRMRDYTENILQSVKGGVITFDLDSRITKINSSAIAALEAEETSISETEEHIRGTDLWNLVEEGLRFGETVTGREIRMTTLTGHSIPIDASTSLLREGNHPIGLVVTFRDLSRLKVLEEQIRRADRLASLGHLSAGVAHEIRNPLGIIKGSASILHRRFGEKDGEEGLTESIIAEVDRLSDVVTNLLDFARPKPPNITRGNLNAVVEKALHLAQMHLVGGKIEIHNELSPDLPLIPIDPEQCEQVFLNLVLNALEAMEEGGTLTVASYYDSDEDEAVVTVSDTGVGIDPESREKIFDPFFTEKSQGTGLGLSVTHMIVEAHNGRIEVESEVGEGSTFRVRFPMNQQEGL